MLRDFPGANEMDAEKLLAKLEFEADCASEKKWNEQRLQAIRKPETRAEQSRKRLHQLRARTAEIEEELELRAQVEQEQERFCKADRAVVLQLWNRRQSGAVIV
jgi:hypothetical protein